MRKDGPWFFQGFVGEEEYFCRGTQEVLEEGGVMWCRCGRVSMDGINTCILVVAEEKERHWDRQCLWKKSDWVFGLPERGESDNIPLGLCEEANGEAKAVGGSGEAFEDYA